MQKWGTTIASWCVIALISLGLVATPAQAQTEPGRERITQFKADWQINLDGSIDITETIQYVPPYEKHGIYRYVPFRYPRPPFVTTSPIKNVSVQLDNGLDHPFERSSDETNVTLKIGDPDATFSQPRTYVISYTVERAIQVIDGQPELYWDVTGEGWSFPIEEAVVHISSPEADILELDCFSGAFGSDDGECVTLLDESAASATYQETISYGHNMTVALRLDPTANWVLPVSGPLKWWAWFYDNWLVLLIPLPTVLMAGWWFAKGRDYVYYTEPLYPGQDKPVRKKGLFELRRIPFVYEPLAEATPGQAGVVLDERVNNQDVIAEILDLARKRYLKIEGIYKNERQKQKGKAKDYLFIKLKEADAALPNYQRYLHKRLFKDKKTEQKLSKLKGSFASTFESTKTKLARSVKNKDWFTTNPSTARGMGLGLAAGLNMVAGIGVILYVIYTQWPWWLMVFVAQAPVSFLFGWNLPQKTALGSAMMARAKGLRKSIRYGKWREEIKEKRLFIDEVLPFAIATGVISQLTKDMQDLNLPEPDYVSGFVSSGAANSWSRSLNDFNSSASSTLSYNPSSSSSSGGSGFSGGFSGGGGGGGGGGSW